MRSISNDNNIDQCNHPEHNTTSDRTPNHHPHNQQPIPPQLSPEPPQKMPRRSARISKREQHQANRLYVHPNSYGNTKPGFFRRWGTAPRQQLRSSKVSWHHELPMGNTLAPHHHRRVAQPTLPPQVKDCLRCQTGNPPAQSTKNNSALRSWNEDLRRQEQRFIRDQEHERNMFMRRIDFHQRLSLIHI